MADAMQDQDATNIVGVTADGMTVVMAGEHWFVSWAKVSIVMGGTSTHDGNTMFIAIGVDDEDGERSLIVADDNPVWTDLLDLLPISLPMAPLAAWAAAIAEFPGAYTLYRRAVGSPTQ